ncbi:MAG: VacB/RNase II family 3'-5' exoribonuclease [Verrucomicrobiota bacterium]|nr:VacB/RNase II family 3'-5' exoribonuclease [Verrucomicrobiota bacterium]
MQAFRIDDRASTIQSPVMGEGGGLREKVLELMRRPGYRPSNKGELARDLELHPDLRVDLRAELAALEREGVIVRGKKARYRLREQEGNLLSGILRFQPKGAAWFYPDPRDPANLASGIDLERFSRIYVGARKTSVALDGDRVALRVERLGPPVWWKHAKHKRASLELPGAEDQATGRVERILQRRSGVVVGILMERKGFVYVQPADKSLPPTIELENAAGGKSGQMVAVRLLEWDSRQVAPRGEIAEVLGWPDEPGVDIRGIILRHGLHEEFPGEVEEEAGEIPSSVLPEALEGRADRREELVITIDPADARDFDDAIWLREHEQGWELAVHIADVAHYVKPGTALDREARKRGNSTYLVDRVLPMLPEALSNGICSLVPGEDRLTCCVVMGFDGKGKMTQVRFEKAVIRSKFRLTYEEAQNMLEGKGDVDDPSRCEIAGTLRECWKLAKLLRQRRFVQGALDLEFPEIRVELDESGRPAGYRREDYNESHQLIEEFMLAANEAVARAVKNAGRPGIYRVHEEPDHDKLFEFAELARAHGYEPGDLVNKKHIQSLLRECRGQPEEHAIKVGLLKSLKRASYREEPLGHYGLSKTDYCHFTSPIRRYADLIMHRALEPLLESPPTHPSRAPAQVQCAEISNHISTTERTSASAETESHRLKMLEWLHLSAHDANPPVFEAVITDVRRIGLMVEALEILQRGLVKRDEFPAGDWRLESHRMRYATMQGAELTLGQVVVVRVARVNMERQLVDFLLVGE